MVTQPQPPRWTVEEYLEMERGSPIKHEYLGGYVYAMAGGTRRHSRISVNVTGALNTLLRDNPCQVFNSDMMVRIDAANYVYPDASVSCDQRDLADGGLASISYPILIVEVLSEHSTAEYDRGDKFNLLYKRIETLQEYILVDPQRIAVEIYRRQADGSWPMQAYGAGEEMVLQSMRCALPIAAFYERLST